LKVYSHVGGNWSNPTNWDLNVVPGLGDVVHITTDATVRLDANTVISSRFLSNVSGLSGPGKLTLTGPLNWTQGTISGTVQRNGGTMGGVAGDGINLTGGQLINTGYMKATLLAGSALDTGSGSVIINLAGRTFDWVIDKGTVSQGAPRGAIYNAWLFRKTGGTGATSIADKFINIATVETQSGILEFNNACVQNAGQTRLMGGSLKADSGFLLNGGCELRRQRSLGSRNQHSGGSTGPVHPAHRRQFGETFVAFVAGGIQIGSHREPCADDLGGCHATARRRRHDPDARGSGVLLHPHVLPTALVTIKAQLGESPGLGDRLLGGSNCGQKPCSNE